MKNSEMSTKFKECVMSRSVISERDYRNLLSDIVMVYLTSGYAIMPNNTSRSNHYDYFCLRRGQKEVTIRTTTEKIRREKRSFFNDPTMVKLTVEENGNETLSRAFYEYRTDHRHGYHKHHLCDTRYCNSVEEWDKFAAKNYERFRPSGREHVTEMMISPQTTARWKDVAKKILPVVRSHRGCKRLPASAIESVMFRSSAEPGRTYLNVTIGVKGKEEIKKAFRYCTPPCQMDVHDVKTSDERICIHGVYMPKWYADKKQRSIGMVRNMYPLKDAEYNNVGFIIVAPHPLYGFTYAITDAKGYVTANGYVPVEEYISSYLSEDERRECHFPRQDMAFLARRYAVKRFPELDILKYAIGDVWYHADISMTVGMRFSESPWGTQYGAFDLGDINVQRWNADVQKWNSGELLEFCDDGTAVVYGEKFSVESCCYDDEGAKVRMAQDGDKRHLMFVVSGDPQNGDYCHYNGDSITGRYYSLPRSVSEKIVCYIDRYMDGRK